ncbi:MAG: SAM-dependent chlorinase/fluorinase [Thermodesulfobacteriota bacterium]
MPRLVALLTDFGLTEPYVAQMKGVLLRDCPGARVVDVSHGVEPFNLAQAGFFLDASRGCFPAGTVFVAVVDPGVGGTRRMVALSKFGQIFLAPDNGLLSLVLDAPGAARCFDFTDFMAESRSRTFHGRDVFAPLAARLAAGQDPESLLPEAALDSLVSLPWSEPEPSNCKSSLTAHVLHVDRFGNCLLNLRAEPWRDFLAAWPRITLFMPGAVTVRLVQSYQELSSGEFGLLAGSQGYLEVALRQASAARELGLRSGHALTLSCERRTRP